MIALPRAEDDTVSYLTSCPIFLSNIKECWAKQSQSSSIFLSAPHKALSSSHACLLCLLRNMTGLLKFNQETRFYLCLCCWPCLLSSAMADLLHHNVLFLNGSFEQLCRVEDKHYFCLALLPRSAFRSVMSRDVIFICNIF